MIPVFSINMPRVEGFTYSAYGLTIGSDIELPGFVGAELRPGAAADVEIRLGRVTPALIDEYFDNSAVLVAEDCDVRVSKRAMCFSYREIADILVADGGKVIVDIREGTTVDELVPYLTGYVIAVLLHQRQCLVLHASVVETGGVAIAFLGAKGDGKSTIAASLEAKGSRLISDDLLPLVFGDGRRVSALPGYPRIRLFGDSATAVGAERSRMSAVGGRTTKVALSCAKFSSEPIALGAIYVLAVENEIGIRKIAPADAFIEATKHTNVGYYLEMSESLGWHFEKCRALVNRVPFYRLGRPHDFEKIRLVDEALAEHLRTTDLA